MKNSKKLGDLFRSLQPGDVLIIPVVLPLSRESVFLYSAILRRDGDGDLYISCPQQSRPSSKLCGNSPIHWNKDLEMLASSSDQPLRWYSDDIQVIRGDAMDVVSEYLAIPRGDKVRHKITDVDSRHFAASPDHPILHGIAENNEAGTLSDQLSLVLDHIGLEHSTGQLTALHYFVERVVAKCLVRQGVTIAIIADNNPGETETSTPPGCVMH